MQKSSSWLDIRPQAELPKNCPFVTEQELLAARRMRNPRRRDEWLLWRAIVREHLGRDTQIDYDASGAPVLGNRTGYIGVSHCKEAVAVMYSPKRCAIDIESLWRNFDKIAPRFLSDAERKIEGSDHPLFAAAAWCVKEAVYKYSGIRQAEFLRDIAITECDWQNMVITARTPWQNKVEVSLRKHGQTLLAIIG